MPDPAFSWVPAARSSNGDLAAALGEQIGLTPDADQRAILDAIYAESSPGVPACFEVGVIAPRQNLKTATLQIAALADLFVFGDELVIWTAHLFKTAVSAFEGMVRMIEANPDLKSQCRWPPRTANGDEAIELKSGQRIEFHARSKGGGRGLSGDKVILDEGLFLAASELGALLPTLATRPAAQVRYGSSAGLASSDALRGVRDRGRAGSDASLAYFEWCAPHAECAQPDCLHAPETPGCALDRRDLWAAANPALGRRISESRIAAFRRSMPPDEFAREFLGWWDEPAVQSQGIPSAAWEACGGDPGQIRGRVAFAFDVALDRSRSSIAVAGSRADGLTQVEVVENGAGTEWVVDRLAEMVRTWRPVGVALDASGPAAALVPELERRRIDVMALPRAEVVQACGGMFDAVNARKVAHLDDPILNSAAAAARLRPGEAYVFTRKGPADISPLYAATLARWVVTQKSKSKRVVFV